MVAFATSISDSNRGLGGRAGRCRAGRVTMRAAQQIVDSQFAGKAGDRSTDLLLKANDRQIQSGQAASWKSTQGTRGLRDAMCGKNQNNEEGGRYGISIDELQKVDDRPAQKTRHCKVHASEQYRRG